MHRLYWTCRCRRSGRGSWARPGRSLSGCNRWAARRFKSIRATIEGPLHGAAPKDGYDRKDDKVELTISKVYGAGIHVRVGFKDAGVTLDSSDADVELIEYPWGYSVVLYRWTGDRPYNYQWTSIDLKPVTFGQAALESLGDLRSQLGSIIRGGGVPTVEGGRSKS